jgi:hypothetical protein
MESGALLNAIRQPGGTWLGETCSGGTKSVTIAQTPGGMTSL